MTIPPMPPVNPPRPLDGDPTSRFHESDVQWVENNMPAVVWFLSNAASIRTLLDKPATP